MIFGTTVESASRCEGNRRREMIVELLAHRETGWEHLADDSGHSVHVRFGFVR